MELNDIYINFYPELIRDGVIYACVFVITIIVCKWLWDIKEERRLRKVWKDYKMKLEDEE